MAELDHRIVSSNLKTAVRFKSDVDTRAISAYLNRPDVPGRYYPVFRTASGDFGLRYYFDNPDVAFEVKMRFG